MNFVGVAALVVVVGLAFMLDVSDAPNASAVLIASRRASYRPAMEFSFAATAVGRVLASEAVARTMMSLVGVSSMQLPARYLPGGVAALAFTVALIRRGIPANTSIAPIDELAGAAVVERGWGAVGWSGPHAIRPYGMIGSRLAILRSAGARRLCRCRTTAQSSATVSIRAGVLQRACLARMRLPSSRTLRRLGRAP